VDRERDDEILAVTWNIFWMGLSWISQVYQSINNA